MNSFSDQVSLFLPLSCFCFKHIAKKELQMWKMYVLLTVAKAAPETTYTALRTMSRCLFTHTI